MENSRFKFRAYDELNKEMRYSDKHDGEFYMNRKGILYMYKIPNSNTGDDKQDYYKNYDVMQYTGLKDKNGIEIYEGDIVKIQHYHDRRKYIPGFVKFEDSAFLIDVSDIETYISNEKKDIEVIGNIYENKELLNDN